MKTYEELTSEILTKAKVEKKARRKRFIAAGSSVVSVALVLTVSLVIAHFAGAFSSDEIVDEPMQSAAITPMEDYGQIYDRLDIYRETVFDKIYNGFGDLFGGFDTKEDSAVLEDGGFDMEAEDFNSVTSDSSTGTGSDDYSETNIQVEGIMEADVVKTDGEYIYVLSFNKLFIISADDGNMEMVSETVFYSEEDAEYTEKSELADQIVMESASSAEMYIYGDRLIIIYSTYSYDHWYDPYTYAAIYDISDRKAPMLDRTVGLSGDYMSSRMNGGTLYLMSCDRFYDANIDEDDPTTYIPTQSVDGEESLIAVTDIYCGGRKEECTYLNICTVDVESCEIGSRISMLGYGYAEFYQSAEYLYAAKESADETSTGLYRSQTTVTKIALGEKLELVADAIVDGSLLNSFSMDEYNGYFRMVVTVRKETALAGEVSRFVTYNNLYVLDEKLNVTGKIEGLAEDERIYSARFDGAIAYFVTYRETDPLFCADLSDPANPVILSELKIPGFSEYLHKYTDDLLFGLGQTDSGSVKLSMFNISDKENVTEEDITVLNSTYYSEAARDHHAILVDSEKNLIAFPGMEAYHVYSYVDGEFVRKAMLPLDTAPYYSSWSARGLYIGDYLYVCTQYGVNSYSLSDFGKAGSITLAEYEDINY